MNDESPTNGRELPNASGECIDPHAIRLHGLLDEYRSLIASGKPIAMDQFLADHTEFASELRELIPLADVLAGWSNGTARAQV